jgi:hypothetical protein
VIFTSSGERSADGTTMVLVRPNRVLEPDARRIAAQVASGSVTTVPSCTLEATADAAGVWRPEGARHDA